MGGERGWKITTFGRLPFQYVNEIMTRYGTHKVLRTHAHSHTHARTHAQHAHARTHTHAQGCVFTFDATTRGFNPTPGFTKKGREETFDFFSL